MNMVIPGEEGPAEQHLRKDAPRTPDIDFLIVVLPRKHDFGGAVVAGRDVSGHAQFLDAREAEIADFQVAILVDEEITRFEVAVDDTGGVDVF